MRLVPEIEGRMASEQSPARLITGLFETHITVAALDRAMEFYGNVLGLELGVREEARRVAFYWIGGWGRALLGLWETRGSGPIAPQHFAFEVGVANLDQTLTAVKAEGIVLRNFFGEVTDVPSVFAWIPAASIYFQDPDGHSLEFLAKLPGGPQPSLGIVPLTAWPELLDKQHERT
jgi:catechol 2,3-dioxygenase-like lactoylglutathione lyase family enzyme